MFWLKLLLAILLPIGYLAVSEMWLRDNQIANTEQALAQLNDNGAAPNMLLQLPALDPVGKK